MVKRIAGRVLKIPYLKSALTGQQNLRAM